LKNLLKEGKSKNAKRSKNSLKTWKETLKKGLEKLKIYFEPMIN